MFSFDFQFRIFVYSYYYYQRKFVLIFKIRKDIQKITDGQLFRLFYNRKGKIDQKSI
jgi:hypothetical protein